MSEDWGVVALDVIEALKEVGTTGTLRRFSAGSAKPWEASTATETDTTVRVMFDEFTWAQKAGAAIEDNDVRLIVATEGLTSAPTPADKLIVQGVTYAIVEVRPLRPGGVDLLYDVQARK